MVSIHHSDIQIPSCHSKEAEHPDQTSLHLSHLPVPASEMYHIPLLVRLFHMPFVNDIAMMR